MNVTEKQKIILLDFMKRHPDLGRGRLRWNSENKQKLNQMWDEITVTLNSGGCGPQKKSKEWAKTWRDWKSNVLKKVAAHKTYSSDTGEGSPQILKSTQVEDSLLEFLTPVASDRLSGIPEGGFGDEFPLAVPTSSIIKIDEHSQWKSIDDDDDDDPMKILDCEDNSTKVTYSASLRSSVPTTASVCKAESSREYTNSSTNKVTKKLVNLPNDSLSKEITASENRPSGGKATSKRISHSTQDKTLNSDKYERKILEIKQEKLLLYKSELVAKRKHRQAVLGRLDEIKTAINGMKDMIQENLEGQYLT